MCVSVDGNSVVRDLVARGEVKVGLTDTDDVNVALEDGQPVAMVLPDKDGLGLPVMPNMVSLIANAPHLEEARKLIDYLLSAEVERRLAQSEAVQIPLHTGVPGPKNIPAIQTFRAHDARFCESGQPRRGCDGASRDDSGSVEAVRLPRSGAARQRDVVLAIKSRRRSGHRRCPVRHLLPRPPVCICSVTSLAGVGAATVRDARRTAAWTAL